MALYVECNNPDTLIERVKDDINNKRIDTWLYDEDGDFTHSTEQWKNCAWMRPHINNNTRWNLSFGFISNIHIRTTKTLYSVFHARLLEMMLTHYDEEITNFLVSSMPQNIDTITTKNDGLNA